MPDTITLPLSPREFWLLVLIVGLIAGSLLVMIVMPTRRENTEKPALLLQLVQALGVQKPNTLQLTAFTLLLWVFVPLFLAAIVATFLLLANVITPGLFPNVPDGNLGLGALMVALLGTPFLVWRTAVAQASARTAELALFNEKINAATEGLHAMRQNTLRDEEGNIALQDGQPQSIWEADITRRNAAIDALHGLAEERPAETTRIARMLSVYVRELSREVPAEPVPDDKSPDELREWADTLKPKRSDMEKAVQTLGRLRKITPDLAPSDIDLTGANLQGMNLGGLDFTKATLSRAQLQGAFLFQAQMKGAFLTEAQMQGAHLSEAQLQGAFLFQAQMKGASLTEAQMKGVDLWEAQLQGAFLFQAQMQGADLSEAQMQGADLRGADAGSGPQRGADAGGGSTRGGNAGGGPHLGADAGGEPQLGADVSGHKSQQSCASRCGDTRCG